MATAYFTARGIASWRRRRRPAGVRVWRTLKRQGMERTDVPVAPSDITSFFSCTQHILYAEKQFYYTIRRHKIIRVQYYLGRRHNNNNNKKTTIIIIIKNTSLKLI